jgi:hypothetical protein
MRIASYFQRRRWVGLRPVRLVPARVLAGFLLFGCFFELEELQPPIGGFGNTGSVGPGGGGGLAQGGSLNGGSGGSSGEPNGCPLGEKLCGELCVAMTASNGCGNPTCSPCAQPAQATVSCNPDTRECQVDSCNSGYADCDGNLSTYTGADAGNGCEYSFGDIRTVAQPLDVPFTNRITLEDQGGRNDWTGIPAYPLQATCPGCVDNEFPAVIAKSEAPPKEDLDAYVRVAWDGTFLYVLAEAFDNSIFHEGLRLEDEGDGRCQNGAPCEDGIALFFDGRNNRDVNPTSGNDDFRVFLGLAGAAYRPGAGAVSPADIQFARVFQPSSQPSRSLSCYRIEAQISWKHIVDVQGGVTAIAGLFPPENGQQYGFDISVNDWDPAVSDGSLQRQSELFYVTPNDNYTRDASGYIAIELSGRPGADAGP